MKITKKTKGIIDEGWRYKYEGDLISDEEIEIDLDKGLYVTGSIGAGNSIKAGNSIEAGNWIKAGDWIEAGNSIKAGNSIDAGNSIEAGDWIKAGDWIEAGNSIKAGDSIEAGNSIEAGDWIKAGDSIEAGDWIKAGDYNGISAGLYITCKGTLSFGLNAYAGIKTWGEATEEEKTITCGKLLKGNIEYGILKETGIEVIKDNLVGKEVEVTVDGKKYKAVIQEA